MSIQDELMEELLRKLVEAFEAENPEEVQEIVEKTDTDAALGEEQMIAFANQDCSEGEDGSCAEHTPFHDIGRPILASLMALGLKHSLLNSTGLMDAFATVKVISIALATAAWVGYQAAVRDVAETPNLDLSGLKLDPTEE